MRRPGKAAFSCLSFVGFGVWVARVSSTCSACFDFDFDFDSFGRGVSTIGCSSSESSTFSPRRLERRGTVGGEVGLGARRALWVRRGGTSIQNVLSSVSSCWDRGGGRGGEPGCEGEPGCDESETGESGLDGVGLGCRFALSLGCPTSSDVSSCEMSGEGARPVEALGGCRVCSSLEEMSMSFSLSSIEAGSPSTWGICCCEP